MLAADIVALRSLRNRYYAMRHGQSLANCEGLIVSHPKNGLHGYGLSESGRRQVHDGIADSKLDLSTRIISSDFKRARETAELVYLQLDCRKSVEFDARLRERHFGDLELGTDNRYPEIWAADQRDPNHCDHNVENVYAVLARASAVVLDCERRFSGETCLLVAHGDVLQILQTAFYRLPPSRHRDLPHLQTASVRALKLRIPKG